MYIYSNRVYTATGVKPAYLKVADGKITAILSAEAQIKADYDFGNQRIIPGIIDVHNHGGFGYMFDDSDEADIKTCLHGQAAYGVTAIMPTTTNYQQYPLLAKISQTNNNGAKIVGIHSEGPWGSRVGEKGVNEGYPTVDLRIAKAMVEAGQGLLKMVGIAPEVPQALEAIDYFTSQGVIMAAYHTNANYAEANLGIDHGISVATHLANVMTGLHHRDIGTMGASLLRDEVYVEVICDGLHVSNPMLELIFKLKDHNKIMLISDNVSYLGAPVGFYKGWSGNEANDRAVIEVTEAGFVLSSSGRLSGSSKPVLFGIKNLMENLHFPLETVLKFTGVNPARKFGLTSKGEINVGKDLDIVVIDDNFEVLSTFVEGREVYQAKRDKIPFNPEFLNSFRLK